MGLPKHTYLETYVLMQASSIANLQLASSTEIHPICNPSINSKLKGRAPIDIMHR